MLASSLVGDQELRDLARQYEPERYLTATLASEPERSALIALAAYASDLSRIVATATQPMLGEIRLQWWRDSFEAMDKGAVIGSPIADALGRAIKTYNLPVPMLIAMSEARAFDLYDDPMPDQSSLDGYFSKTEAIPFELALRVLGVTSGDAVRLSQPAGRVYGMTRLLAQLPAHLAKGRMPLPLNLLPKGNWTPVTLLEDQGRVAFQSLITGAVQDIEVALASLRPQIRALSPHQRVALLPLACVAPYLRAIEARKRNPVRDIADLAPLARVWRIGLAHMLGRL